jgi:hypothetical protein
MPDEIDVANSIAEDKVLKGVHAIRAKAQAIPAGEPGECDHCGEFSPRLVRGACARCRDKLKLD